MFLLDTNVVSEFRKSAQANRNVIAWAGSVPADDFFLSVVSLFEIELGTRRIARRDEKQAAMLRQWIDHTILARFGARILSVDVAIAMRCAELHVPDPRSDRDAYIAATALVHGMTVVTRNVADFEPMGVPVLNPWETSASRL